MQQKFSLQEIANWQLDQDNSKVTLPSIQRGFVWKPKQVEDLWDSIMRGYPIGSFLLSQNGQKYDLMDGQQRSTSIFIGYHNPYADSHNHKTWSLKKIPVLWIDLKPTNISNTSKFSFRLITSSHPWGYQAKDNNQKLSVSDRRNALQLFRKNPQNNGGH
ncbi:GmrSD restriction endonuclease domain-containing protein [Myroides sp. LJL115]